MDAEPTTIEALRPDLWRVPLETPTLPPATRTNTFVWRDAEGVWIVDPGSPRRKQLARLTDWLDEEHGSQPLRGYVLTHHHPDHWSGLKRLLSERPAPVIAQQPSHYSLDASFRTVDWFHQQTTGVELLATPGHASDHLVLRFEDGDVIVGDLVAGVGTVVINPPDGHMGAYLDSLQLLLDRDVTRLFPAHGPTVDDGPAKLREYLDHRLQREKQVIDAVRALGPARPSRLVPRIYPDIPKLLWPVAARSVLAHLIKLEEEGRAVRRGKKWTLA